MADNDAALTGALRAIAADDVSSRTSPAVQVRLLEEVRGLRRSRRRGLVKSAMIAAVLCIGTALPIWRLATLPRYDMNVSQVEAGAPPGEMTSAFFPLEYSAIPMSGGRLVRLEVPREAMMAFGLEDPDPGSGSPVILADVMVGDDGLARAVRFVRPAISEVQKERR